MTAMQMVNDQILRDSNTHGFVTAFAATLDPASHELRWCSAGHEPAIVRRASGDGHERLAATGPPLGVLAEPLREGAPLVLLAGTPVELGVLMDFASAGQGIMDEVRLSGTALGPGETLLPEPGPGLLTAVGGLVLAGRRSRRSVR